MVEQNALGTKAGLYSISLLTCSVVVVFSQQGASVRFDKIHIHTCICHTSKIAIIYGINCTTQPVRFVISNMQTCIQSQHPILLFDQESRLLRRGRQTCKAESKSQRQIAIIIMSTSEML